MRWSFLADAKTLSIGGQETPHLEGGIGKRAILSLSANRRIVAVAWKTRPAAVGSEGWISILIC
jgi:hypothetical protein